MTNQPPQIHSIFPTPVYIAKRDSNLSFKEEKEIRKIIEEEGMYRNIGNSTSNNSDIFDGKLKKLKQFCEQQLKLYVKEVLNPKKELDFYITQSWLNVTKPGEYHHNHSHSNSLISGVFYISTEEDDRLTFTDPKAKEKEAIKFERKKYNPINSTTWWFPSVTNELMLFPSWLEHQVEVNEKATTDRISISFNTFVRGALGNRKELTELILK